MLFRIGTLLVCFLVSVGGASEMKFAPGPKLAPGRAISSISDATSDSKESSATSPRLIDTCALIEKAEIASVQGSGVRQAQPTTQKYGDLEISQCYYTAISEDGLKNLGVFLQVIHRDRTKSGQEVIREYWNERFGREVIERLRKEDELKAKTRTERQKAKAIRPPARVAGVGDEAFWVASMRGGGLFVLKKDKVVRISVGSTGDERADIEKSKMLAKKALARLD